MLRMVIFFFRFKNAFLAEAQQFKINISFLFNRREIKVAWFETMHIHTKWSSNIMEKRENQTTVNTEDYDFIYSQKYTAYLSKKTLKCIIV